MDKPGALARDSSIKFWQRIPGVPNKLSRKHPVQPIRFSKAEKYKKDDRLLAVNKFAASQSVDFPINAYTSVIEYSFAIGGKYYVETEQTYKTAPTGKQDWAPRESRCRLCRARMASVPLSFFHYWAPLKTP